MFSNVLPVNTTIEVICYKYKPLKNNELPLKLRITKDRKRSYINIGISIAPTFWDFAKNQPKPNCPNKEYIEKVIACKISELRDSVIKLKSENKDFTAASLLKKIEQSSNKNITVGELFQEHIKFLEQNKRHGYAGSVKEAYNSMIRYNGHLNIYFSEIDVAWLKRYEQWLRRRGNAENTIGIRLRTLRMLYNVALERDIIKFNDYPFRRYKVSKLHQATAKRAITKEQIQAIINYHNEQESQYRCLAIDVFTFSYLNGRN